MSRLYIDLTTSARWRRPAVGVVRVEREFARHCLAHEPGSVFCEVGADGAYRAISRARVRAILDDAWCRTEPVAMLDAHAPAARAPKRGRVQRFLDRSAHRAAKLLPAGAYPLGRDAGCRLVDRHGAHGRRSAPAPGPGDLFFSIGLQWQYGAIHAQRLKQRSGVGVVEACHDTIPIDHPEHAGVAKQQFAEHLICIANTADMVLAVSDSSRAGLAGFYERVGASRVPPIRTVRPGGAEAPAPGRDLEDDERAVVERLRGAYVLYVSTFETRKNHRLLLQLWKELHRQRGEACPLLVLVGMFGWGVDDLWAEIRASEVWAAGRIALLQHVSDALLAQLYRGCAFTVFPSFCEGWGLAATESLAHGKLAITSDAPALREATQGLGPAIHPLDWPRWLDTISRYLDDAEALAAAEARIRASYLPRHWGDFSADLLAAARGCA